MATCSPFNFVTNRRGADLPETKKREVSLAELANAHRFGRFCPVYKVDDKTIVKTGKSVRLAEAEAMNYLRQNTSIPVPELFNAYRDETSGHVRILMEFIEGDKLEDVWDTFDSTQRHEVIVQLKDYFTELRQLKGTFVGSVDGTACEDPILTKKLVDMDHTRTRRISTTL
jgi:hypothetical protein